MNKLAERAHDFEREVEECLVDAKGLLRSALDARTMKPIPPGFFTDQMDIIRSVNADMDDYSELMEYENSGMVSGAYLCAMLLKYNVTKDPVARERAYRTFYGIKDLYDRSQNVEPGFLAKPYGGKITRETSSDQYIYVLTALDRFCKIAAKSERTDAARMIRSLSAYWTRRAYQRDYFGSPLQWPLNRFTGFVWLNYVYSGDDAMRQELLRLAALPEVRETLPFAERTLDQLWDEYGVRDKTQVEKKHGKMLIGGGAETAQSGALSIDSCLEYNAPCRDLWLRQLAGLHERGKISIRADGLELIKGFYEPTTGAYEPVRPAEYVNGDESFPFGYKILAFAGNILSGMHATMFARATVCANEYFPAREKVALARRILEQVDHDKLRWYIDPDGEFPPEMEWHAHVYAGDAVAHWLWAYWQGRSRGIWP